MSNLMITKYNRKVRPINDENVVNAMLEKLTSIPTNLVENKMMYEADDVGVFVLYVDSEHPNKVIEYVKGAQDDSVTTLYANDPSIMNLYTLSNARRELINEIGAVTTRLPSTISVYDAGRERELSLKELGTAQLIDVLAMFTHTDLRSA